MVKFSERGLKCAYMGEDQDDPAVKAAVIAGDCQRVYMSPELLLCVLHWREMFQSGVYQKNLVATVVDEVHCVEKWLVSAQTYTYIVSRQSHVMFVTLHTNAKLFD